MSGYWFAPARSGPVTRTVPTASKADVTPEPRASSARIISASDDVGLPTIPVIEFPPGLPAGTMEHAALLLLGRAQTRRPSVQTRTLSRRGSTLPFWTKAHQPAVSFVLSTT